MSYFQHINKLFSYNSVTLLAMLEAGHAMGEIITGILQNRGVIL